MRGGRRTIPLGGENKVWRFRVEEEGIRDNIRIETVGRNAVSREDVPTPTTRGITRDVGYQPTWKPSRDQSMKNRTSVIGV